MVNRSRSTALWTVLPALLCGLPASGQEPQPPVFPAGTGAVLLDMVARDAEGRVVPDLRPDEVQVFEDGEACEISSFRLVQPSDSGPSRRQSGDVSSRPSSLVPFRGSGGPSDTQGTQPASARAPSATVEDDSLGRSTGSERERLASVVLLVFDRLGLEAARLARDAALDMTRRSFPDDTWFAVLTVGHGLSILQPLTDDAPALAGAIERATKGSERAAATPLDPGHAGAAEEALALAFEAEEAEKGGAGAGELAIARAAAGLAAFSARMEGRRIGQGALYPLVAIARALRAVRGRKTMLYFAEGLQVPPDLLEVFQAAISDANRSNLTVYAFDTRGLAVHGYDPGVRTLQRGGASPWNLTRGALGSGEDDAADPIAGLVANPGLNLQGLAEGTGGFLVADTNDLRPSLERVGADLRSYYEIVYTSPNPRADGAWREIEVKVSRPGVRARARKGYFALPAAAPVVRPSELPLMAALESAVPPRQIPLSAAAVHLAGAGEARDVLIALKVPLEAATYADGRARLSLLAVVRDADGDLVARMSHETSLDEATAGPGAALPRSLVVKRALRLAPGRYALEAAVLDREGARLGARRVAFDVPAGSGFGLGSVAIVRPEPLPEGSSDLLRAGDVRGTPRLGEPIPAAEDEVVGVFLSLQPDGTPEPSGLTLEVSRDGEVLSRSAPTLPPPDAAGRIVYIGQLPASAFPPGQYVVHVRAHQGVNEATAATSFRVVEPPVLSADTGDPGPSEPVPEVPAEVAPVLGTAGEYVVDFQGKFRNIVAHETYRQWMDDEVTTLQSDIVFVTLPGPIQWVAFRDVYEVDGRRIRDRDSRLESLFLNPDRSALERAEAIRQESARFNIGDTYRDVNVPTLALVALHPDYQGRFQWEIRGTREFFGRTGVELRANEVARPTLVRDLDDGDVPIHARFWVEPDTGRVLRTETRYRSRAWKGGPWSTGWIGTQYRPAPSLALWVPESMTERYDEQWGPIEGRAVYSEHRRFQVSTSETGARLADEPSSP